MFEQILKEDWRSIPMTCSVASSSLDLTSISLSHFGFSGHTYRHISPQLGDKLPLEKNVVIGTPRVLSRVVILVQLRGLSGGGQCVFKTVISPE